MINSAYSVELQASSNTQAPPTASASAPAANGPRPSVHTGPITALQLIERIRGKAGVPAGADTEDYVVAGDPTIAVTGIATTVMATMDCLKAAAAAGKNFIVTLESTFWSDNDNLDRLEGSASFKTKRDFIRSNNMVCFHLHSHWPAHGANGTAVGMAKELGWEAYVTDAANPTTFKLPRTTLLGLAQQLSTQLNDRTMRIVGDPKLDVTTVAANWGNANQMPAIHLLNGPADVVLVGYTFEWEAVEYTQDMIATGKKKGLILLGETKSEQGGMKYCADWIKSFVTEIPVEYIAASEPYWNPQNPVFGLRATK